MNLPKVAIVGSGSIGLYYGAKLASIGCDVRFLMRSGLAAARASGIRVHSADGSVHLPNPGLASHPAEIGPCDGVIVSVKATSNDVLPSLIPPLLGENTWILTLQNGLGNEEFLASHFGEDRILGGLCFVCLTRRNPVEVDHVGHGALSLGEFNRPATPRLQALASYFHTSGVPTRAVDDLAGERWRKLVWNIPFNGLCTRERVTVDHILSNPALFAECRALMSETLAIASAQGHEIPPDFPAFQIERTRTMGPYRPSTLVDAEAGNALEIEPMWGEPSRRAVASKIETPLLNALYTSLRQSTS